MDTGMDMDMDTDTDIDTDADMGKDTNVCNTAQPIKRQHC